MKKVIKFFSLKRILFYLLIILVALQFIPVDRSLPSSDPKNDFFAANNTPAAEMQLIKNACYDCHSNTTRYPWYSYISPVSLYIQGHVDHGRDELNFSLWDGYSDRRKARKLEECVEMIQEGEMPLWSHRLIHKESRLNNVEKDQLVMYFKSLR